ncbi:unnamed protein product [Darwinula stevensoni]|uniref:Uncharacterized protein n=1 Tax=Darwinula stevensoni TaxID=69355 RepID=A0A7R9AEP8_9CRUS|nr:unnamed protein product [Darwinula stevensoni]CAG0902199.1 unnamed protein product [Darwinula stevensoni]
MNIDKSIIVMVSENKNDGGHPLKIKGNKEGYPGIKAAKPHKNPSNIELEFDGRMDTVAFPVTRICMKTKITKLIIGEYMKERTISRVVQGINLMISNVRDGIECESGQRQGDGSQSNAITNPGLSRHSTSSESRSELQSTEDHTRSARKRSWLAESTQQQRKKTKTPPGEAILNPAMLAKCYFGIHEIPLSNVEPSPAASRHAYHYEVVAGQHVLMARKDLHEGKNGKATCICAVYMGVDAVGKRILTLHSAKLEGIPYDVLDVGSRTYQVLNNLINLGEEAVKEFL